MHDGRHHSTLVKCTVHQIGEVFLDRQDTYPVSQSISDVKSDISPHKSLTNWVRYVIQICPSTSSREPIRVILQKSSYTRRLRFHFISILSSHRLPVFPSLAIGFKAKCSCRKWLGVKKLPFRRRGLAHTLITLKAISVAGCVATVSHKTVVTAVKGILRCLGHPMRASR